MPYQKSRAREEFEGQIAKLLLLSRKASFKKTGFDYDHQNLIFQSAIFLSCAAIEEYLKSFFEDLFYRFRSEAASVGELPENSRLYTLLHDQKEIFKSYINSGDERKSLRKMSSSKAFDVLVESDRFMNQVSAGKIIGTRKYPSTKNLKALFNRIGIEDILGEANKKGKKDYKVPLESFLSVREAISHQSPPSLTFKDVERNLNHLNDLINRIDRISYSHVSYVADQKYWPKK